jgi:hypothetical protein
MSELSYTGWLIITTPVLIYFVILYFWLRANGFGD